MLANALPQKTVRGVMNSYIGIRHDKDICQIEDLPTQRIIDAYDDDPCNAIVKPTLDPMRPALTKIRSEWNETLWELLETEELRETGFDSIEMRSAFFNRLSQLARTIRDLRRRDNETQAQFEERRTGNAAKRRQRAHTRRSTVRTICISYPKSC